MKALIDVLKARWFLTLLGTILLALIIWFFGPLFAFADVRPLASEIVRFVVVMLLFIVWGLTNLFSVMRAKKAESGLMKDLEESESSTESEGAIAADEEVALLGNRMKEALALLKTTKLGGAGGKKHLYQLPWYIIIGPPGAGKTTALANSGLHFPLADKFGGDSLQGVGGTRNCDWWFADEAVLIDTAGRYTTQDSQQAVDKAAWSGFLEILKKNRERQPINGAIIAISLAELAVMSEAERQSHARAIKERLRELNDAFNVRFPIYVLLTKADLIAGFMEFFEDMGGDERAQVWGMTFPFEDGGTSSAVSELFDGRFDDLLTRLNDRLLDRLQQESDVERRGLIYGFPRQMASLKEPISDFLADVFRPSRYDVAPLLRGVYFTSGTQDGRPIDRIMGAMANTFGIQRQSLTGFSGMGRSYFLTNLLRRVIFAEAGAVTSNRKVERRRTWIQTAVYAAALLAVLAMAGLWFNSYRQNDNEIGEVRAALAEYDGSVAPIDPDVLRDPDLKQVVPPLNILRGMPTGYGRRDESVPVSMRLGLYQGDKLSAQSEFAYREALNKFMLPRLLVRLENQMRNNFGNPEYLYQALKVYLMLGKQGKIDAELIRRWLLLDWNRVYPGQVNQDIRTSLQVHLDSLLERPFTAYPLDGNLVGNVRQQLRDYPLTERAFAILQQSPKARSFPDWRLTEHAGRDAELVFVRRSGRPLDEGVPGFYTYDAFHEAFLPEVSQVALELARESWVLGEDADIGLDPAQIARLRRDVLDRYYEDYATHWELLLQDIAIVPFRDMGHTVRVLNILSSPDSPLNKLVQSVVHETKLSVPPPDPGLAESATALAGEAADALSNSSSSIGRLDGIVGEIQTGDQEEAPGAPVDRRFANLHLLTEGGENGPTQLDGVIRSLDELYRQLNRLSLNSGASSGSDIAGATAEAAQLQQATQMLAATAGRLPEPAASWLSSVAKSSTNVTVGGARQQVRQKLNAAWNSQALPSCRQAVEGRYPVYRDSNIDMGLSDFGRIFGPGGELDNFFNSYLRNFVDTSRRPWRWQSVDNINLGIPNSVLMEFQRAAVIRDSLFSGGGQLPGMNFEIVPVNLDSTATQVNLDMDGQSLVYRHGPQRFTRMSWPGPGGRGEVRLAFAPLIPGEASGLTLEGPWSWFRMLDQGRIIASDQPDRFDIAFQVGSRAVTFGLRANTVVNPFTLPELGQFRCPPSL